MAKADTAAAPKKKKKTGLIIAVLVLLLAAGGGAAWYFLLRPAHGPAQEAEAPPVFEKLDAFTVNLVDGEHYLQVEFSLKLADAKLSEGVQTHMPEIRDAVLRLLSGKKIEELTTAEGKAQLSDEIRSRVNQALGVKDPQEGVRGVFFTSFVIQ